MPLCSWVLGLWVCISFVSLPFFFKVLISFSRLSYDTFYSYLLPTPTRSIFISLVALHCPQPSAIKSIKSDLCYSYMVSCVVNHMSMVNSPGITHLKKTDSSSHNNHQLWKVPWLFLRLCQLPLSMEGSALSFPGFVRAITAAICLYVLLLCYVQKILVICSHPNPLSTHIFHNDS